MTKELFDQLLGFSISSNKVFIESVHKVTHISAAETGVSLSSDTEAEKIYKTSLEAQSG